MVKFDLDIDRMAKCLCYFIRSNIVCNDQMILIPDTKPSLTENVAQAPIAQVISILCLVNPLKYTVILFIISILPQNKNHLHGLYIEREKKPLEGLR